MTDRLTPQDLRVLQAIEDLARRFGFPPSQDEIRAHLGLASGATVRHHLRRLQRAGAVQLRRGQARPYQVARPELLSAAAGSPSPRASPVTMVSECSAGYLVESADVCPALSEAQGMPAVQCSHVAKAQNAEAANQQLIAMVSHELRNPLATIITGLEVLRRRIAGDQEAIQAVEVVARSARTLATTLTDILDLSRMTVGSLRLERTPLVMESVVGPACAAMEPDAREAGLSLAWECQEGLWVCGHGDRLRQAVKILVANAVRFTLSGGHIRARCQAAEGKVRITVAGTAAAVDPAAVDGLREAIGGTPADAPDGPSLGLGLALAKAIIEQHGGRVFVQSGSPPTGSGFIVELPLLPPPG